MRDDDGCLFTTFMSDSPDCGGAGDLNGSATANPPACAHSLALGRLVDPLYLHGRQVQLDPALGGAGGFARFMEPAPSWVQFKVSPPPPRLDRRHDWSAFTCLPRQVLRCLSCLSS